MNVLEAARCILASRPIAELADILTGGPTTLVVGGALRDLLLGRGVHDLDLVVTGNAAQVAQRIAAVRGGHAFELGAAPRSVWRIATAHGTFDVWQADGGLERDIRRRDFTVNSLMWRLPRGPLLDLTGGLDDLSAGRIRVVDPRNLDDDPVRVLRGIRILATHPELALTANAAEHLRRAAPGLRRSPSERLRLELETILAGTDPRRALMAGHRLEILSVLDPAWSDTRAARAAAALAERLAILARSTRGWLVAGTATAMPTVLALPCAGPLRHWQPHAGSAALVRFGWAPRQATRLSEIGGRGKELATQALRGRTSDLREAAISAGELLDPVLALACALSPADVSCRTRFHRLRAWARRFAARPALLDGDRVAEVLELPPGPLRARWVRELRLAQARGEVRSQAGAISWLRGRSGR